MLRELFSSCAVLANEGFRNTERFSNDLNNVGNNVGNNLSNNLANNDDPTPAQKAIMAIIVVVIMITIVLFLGKYLWNNFGCKYITILKPVRNVFELLAIIILLDLVLPTRTVM